MFLSAAHRVSVHPSLCCRAPRFILRLSSPVTDISSVDAVFISLTPASSFPPYPATNGSDWRYFFFLDSGGEVDMKGFFFFSRLPIRTIINPIVKNVTFFIFFCHWVALITLISPGNYRLRKKMNECSVFHCVLWLHTNNFKGFFLLL